MSLRYRKYKSYEKYIRHQSRKLDEGIRVKKKRFLPEKFNDNVRSFVLRFTEFRHFITGGKIVCLGARLGEEVVALRDMGFEDTIGVDINPGKNNQYVIECDFHKMPFKDNSFDLVFTNSLDHMWDLNILSKEISRVLKTGGKFIAEISHIKGTQKSKINLVERKANYESVIWDSDIDIINGFSQYFRMLDKFESKYHRIIVLFQKISTVNEKEG